ncbi:MAG: hypothetical protein QOD86_752 [Miltoncostaeaceae bacterium]|jgi:hypothetical protein|nr:hypothetical protein [Miltoncostaeaceae bacterium]
MRALHIDRKRAVVGWVAFVIARKVVKRKVRRKVGGMRSATIGRIEGMRKALPTPS